MTPKDNDGPSDEEVSATSNSLIDHSHSPKKQPLLDNNKSSPYPPPRSSNHRRRSKSNNAKKSRHEGKIIEIGTSRPTHYESFPHRTSKSSYSRDDDSTDDSHSRRSHRYDKRQTTAAVGSSSRLSPTKQQIGKARQVLVHYHPQMGDEGYESTLLDHNNNNKSSSQRLGGAGGGGRHKPVQGMHSRSIDEVREEHYLNVSSGNDEQDNAATRQLRRRMYRLALERTVSMDEKRRKMLCAEEDVGGSIINRDSTVTCVGRDSRKVHPTKNEFDTKIYTLPTNSKMDTMHHSHASTSSSQLLPPPPPSSTPSYRAIVSNLISQNEPEKLSQLDRVMVKYEGREEELIAKLDLRYRKKKKRGVGQVDRSVGGGNIGGGGSVGQSEVCGSIGQSEVSVEKSESIVERSQENTAVEHKTREEAAIVGQDSPKKDRSAIQMMQSWDRKHTETSEEEEAAAVTKSDPSEHRPSIPNEEHSLLGVSARTSSTRTELHSNMEKDVIDDEGRLPKVPERDTLDSTPKRTVEKVSTPRYSPAYNDDISLITMETKGTFSRNRVVDGEREGYSSYAEMMRRPPASIIVDGSGSSPKGNGNSPASNANSEEYSPKKQQQRGFAPPKIQRLIPEYEKPSNDEKAKAAEAAEEAAAKLDSVEARILARRKLREEQARTNSEEKGQPQSSLENGIMVREENSTMAFDEEESFVGKSKKGEEGLMVNLVIDNSFSLIDSEEANRQSGLDGDEENGLDTTVVRDNTADGVDGEVPKKSIDGPEVERKSVVESEKPPKVKSMLDEDLPLDELNDSIQVGAGHDTNNGERPLDETNDTENSYLTCIQSPRDATSKKDASNIMSSMDVQDDIADKREEEEVAAASRDAEIQLKAMEDEIARLIAEKESRFAAEKAVALKKAEEALEAERRARLKAEQELERLKAEAEERLKIVATLNEPDQSKQEVAADVESIVDIAQNLIKSQPGEAINAREVESSVPLDQDAEELPVSAERAVELSNMSLDADVPLMPVSSMDMETKQELMSMIAEMEQRSMPMADAPPTYVESENEALNDSVDIVEQMRSVWALDDDEAEEDQHVKYAATSDEESDYENAHVAEPSAEFVQDDDGNDSNNSDEQSSYLPGSLHSSPERSATATPMLENFPAMTMPPGLLQMPLLPNNDLPSSAAGMPLLSKNDHDIPSMYMPHRQTSAAQILDTAEPPPVQAEAAAVKPDFLKKPSVFDDEEEGEANIHHVAKVTFDGNPAKGQLSFTSGTEVLAHSNQRGEWWLGRCGGRTGWFPASAVVPASEYLKSLGPALGVHKSDEESIDDVDLEFPKLSQEELQETYDLIRSPSGEDESPRRPARDLSNTKPDPNEDSDTAEPQSEPFVNGQSNVRSAYDSMLDEYDSMLAPAATEQPTTKDDPSLNATAQTKQPKLNTTTSSEEKKPKRIWRSANDPNTGLTYYYNVKTRETTWEKPDDFVEKPPAKPQPPVEPTNETEVEVGIKEAVAKEPSKGSRMFLGLFSKSTTKKNDTRSRSVTPTNVSLPKYRPSSPKSTDATHTSKQRSVNAAETEANATNQLVSNLNNNWEVDDVSSVSSEGTSNSIFSAKKVKKVLGKVGSKIAGKMSNPTNASYGALNDSYSQKKSAQVVNNSVDKSVDAGDDVKEPATSSALQVDATQVESRPEKKQVAHDNNEVKPASDKKKSRWRSAIDSQTGRTYYFHKDTQETVWEKPSNF